MIGIIVQVAFKVNGPASSRDEYYYYPLQVLGVVPGGSLKCVKTVRYNRHVVDRYVATLQLETSATLAGRPEVFGD